MNHGRDKTPDVHDPLLPRSAFDHPAWLPGEEETWLTSVIYRGISGRGGDILNTFTFILLTHRLCIY